MVTDTSSKYVPAFVPDFVSNHTIIAIDKFKGLIVAIPCQMFGRFFSSPDPPFLHAQQHNKKERQRGSKYWIECCAIAAVYSLLFPKKGKHVTRFAS